VCLLSAYCRQQQIDPVYHPAFYADHDIFSIQLSSVEIATGRTRVFAPRNDYRKSHLKTQYQKHQGDGGNPSPPICLGLANITY